MTTYDIDLRFVTTDYPSEDALEVHLEQVLDHLYALEGPIDPDLTATLATGEVIFSLGWEADTEADALRGALTAVRTAIHACQGCTHGWEALFDEVEQTVRPPRLVGA